MLKTHPATTAVVNSRIKLAPLVGRLDSTNANANASTKNNNSTTTTANGDGASTLTGTHSSPTLAHAQSASATPFAPPALISTTAISTVQSPPSCSIPAATSAIHTTSVSFGPREYTAEEAYARRYRPMIMTAQTSRDSSPASVQQAPREARRANSRGIGAWFPLGYKEAVSQWWTSVTPQAAERNVLTYVPFLREATTSSPTLSSPATPSDPHGNRLWRSTMVPLTGKNRALNEFSVERVGETAEETLVILHGYGAGLGFFYKNFEPLSRLPGWKLYALDLLGMGNSTRPNFKVTAKDQNGKIEQAENWFVDSLEEWRRARKIERFTLLGHSLGGYLAVSYAIKYPGHLNKLILASPVGVPEDPYAVNAEMPEPSDSALASEFTADQNETTTTHEANGSSAGQGKGNKSAPTSSIQAPRRPMPSWFAWLWDANVSPFSLVRMTGPLGPRFVSGWTSRRFNHLPPEEAQALHDYAYALFRQKGSGEYALPYLLAPGAYARSPVINRIQRVGRQVIRPAKATENSPVVREMGIPVVMMYGENDWMDVAGGFAAKEKIMASCESMLVDETVTEEERRRENGSAKVVVVPAAGHHLYLDNPDAFNSAILRELKDTQAWMKKMRASLPKP